MAVDISAQLRAIANDEYGETVLSNIGSAAEVLNESAQTDISSELATIYNGMYGHNIRRAIYDALFKLSIASPESGGVGTITGTPMPYTHGLALPISLTIYGTAIELI